MNLWHQFVVLGRLFWAFVKCVFITMGWTARHGVYIGVGVFFCWVLGDALNVDPGEPFIDLILGASVLLGVLVSVFLLDSFLTNNHASAWLLQKLKEAIDGNSNNSR